jgi:hypothetical protein
MRSLIQLAIISLSRSIKATKSTRVYVPWVQLIGLHLNILEKTTDTWRKTEFSFLADYLKNYSLKRSNM